MSASLEADDILAKIGHMMAEYIEADGVAIIAIQGGKGVAGWSAVNDGPERAALMRRLIRQLRDMADRLERDLGPSSVPS